MRPSSVRTSTRIKVAVVLSSWAVQLGCLSGTDRGCGMTAVIFMMAAPLWRDERFAKPAP